MGKTVASGLAIGAFSLAAVGLGAPSAQAADFYAGKTINFIVGADAAGGYDVYARAIAKHLAHFIPGTPTIVVQNMPGAGSGKAASYIYAVAPRDGTTIAALFPGVIIDPLVQKRAAAQFDATKITYLASADSDPRVCVTGRSSSATRMTSCRSGWVPSCR